MLITEDQHCNNLNFINLYRPGETLTCGKLTYKVVPELDYYRGIPTILTSEEAALVVCNKIFNSLDNDTEFFDQDFGPKTKDDLDGSTNAMYF